MKDEPGIVRAIEALLKIPVTKNMLKKYQVSEYGWMDGMCVWMDGWMDGWMGGRMNGWMDGMYVCMHANAWMNADVYPCVDGWMCWVNRVSDSFRVNGWMDSRLIVLICFMRSLERLLSISPNGTTLRSKNRYEPHIHFLILSLSLSFH